MSKGKGPPVCPQCGNNACLLDPPTFAEKHLSLEEKKLYLGIGDCLDDFLRTRMAEHRRRIEEA
ncbi:MAG: hypothetical protein ABIH46_11585 [Chloroflexota bacterium]